ncbi:MAG: 2-C-methyl-D-erythritol 4-phosphate cytidylyltransferase [Actinobacteria bacterium]|nr:2-C-methyl-D-erythritol 4-phosphate cytidylyltransferase [Actinomycetota bacterium]
MRTCAIVVAAGAGTRFGAPKQFVPLRGARVAHHAVAVAGASCDDVVVVLPADTTWDGPPVTASVTGGVTRSESVRCGLAAVPDDADVIVVHDAARPLASSALFRAVVAAVETGADGAVPALPVSDTVKQVEGDRVVETVDRDGLMAVQTPQAFRAEVLRKAHAEAPEATDDAALVEALGGAVVVVDGDPRNIKITTALDLELAMALLSGGDAA